MGSAHGDGALGHHHQVVVHATADLPGGLHHVLKVGASVLARRCSHGDENHFGTPKAFADAGGEGQPPFGHIPLEDVIEPGFINGDFSIPEHVHLALIDINAHYVHPGFGKAGPADQPHIPCSYYRYLHQPDFNVRKTVSTTEFKITILSIHMGSPYR